MSMALFSSPPLPTTFTSLPVKPHLCLKPHLTLLPPRKLSLFLIKSADNGAGLGSSVVAEEKLEKKEESSTSVIEEKKEGEMRQEPLESNGSAAATAAATAAGKAEVPKFRDPKWVGGTWDLKQFLKDGKTDWDSVIDAEVKRRKWLEDTPEASSNDEPVVFDTAIIPWWSWVKRFHLPEAELLNGRAAMIGFFMAYLVDSLTGVGLVDQMGNFFCKTLLFVAVVGVLLIRKNEDVENLKKLINETTFYDKQWQATWKDDPINDSKKE